MELSHFLAVGRTPQEQAIYYSEKPKAAHKFLDSLLDSQKELLPEQKQDLDDLIFKVHSSDAEISGKIQHVIRKIWNKEYVNLDLALESRNEAEFINLALRIGEYSPSFLVDYVAHNQERLITGHPETCCQLLGLSVQLDNTVFEQLIEKLAPVLPKFYTEAVHFFIQYADEGKTDCLKKMWEILPQEEHIELFQMQTTGSVLHHAANNKNRAVLQTILELADGEFENEFLTVDGHGNTPLSLAVKANLPGNIELIFNAVPRKLHKKLVNAGNENLAVLAMENNANEALVALFQHASRRAISELALANKEPNIIKIMLNSPRFNLVAKILPYMPEKVVASLLNPATVSSITLIHTPIFNNLSLAHFPYLANRLAAINNDDEEAFLQLQQGIQPMHYPEEWFKQAELNPGFFQSKSFTADSITSRYAFLVENAPDLLLIIPPEVLNEVLTKLPKEQVQEFLAKSVDLPENLHKTADQCALGKLFRLVIPLIFSGPLKMRKEKINEFLKALSNIPLPLLAIAAAQNDSQKASKDLSAYCVHNLQAEEWTAYRKPLKILIQRLLPEDFVSIASNSPRELGQDILFEFINCATKEQARAYFAKFPFVLGQTDLRLIKLYPQERLKECVPMRDAEGNGLLHHLAKDPAPIEGVGLVLRQFSDGELRQMFMPNAEGENPFHIAVKHSVEMFSILMHVMGSEKLFEANPPKDAPYKELLLSADLDKLIPYLKTFSGEIWIKLIAPENIKIIASQGTLNALAAHCPPSCRVRLAINTHHVIWNDRFNFTQDRLLDELMRTQRKEFLNCILSITTLEEQESLIEYLASEYAEIFMEEIKKDWKAVPLEFLRELLFLLSPEAVVQTVAKIPEEHIEIALAEALELPERTVYDGQGIPLESYPSEYAEPEIALSSFYEEYVNKIPKTGGTHLMQETVAEFLNNIPSQTLAFFARSDEVRKYLIPYLPFMEQKALAVTMPFIPASELLPTIKQFSLSVLIRALMHALPAQKQEFILQIDWCEFLFPDWQVKQEEIKAGLLEAKGIEDQEQRQATVEKLLTELRKYSKRPQVWAMDLQEIKFLFTKNNAKGAVQFTPVQEQLEKRLKEVMLLLSEVEALKIESHEAEVPEEFLDHLFLVVMADPVIIPGKRKRAEDGIEEIVPTAKRVDRRNLGQPNADGQIKDPYTNEFYPKEAYKTDIELQKKILASGWLDEEEIQERPDEEVEEE